MTLNGVMAVHCVISLNLVNLRYRKRSVAEFMQVSIVGLFLVRVQCRRKESSCSLSHLLISFLFVHGYDYIIPTINRAFALRLPASNPHSCRHWTVNILWDPLRTRAIPERLLEVCSRQGAIQIHIYLYLYLNISTLLPKILISLFISTQIFHR